VDFEVSSGILLQTPSIFSYSNYPFQKDFIGKEALQRQMEIGVNKRFVQLLLDSDRHQLDNDPWPQGEEPIYRNGKLVGWTTTSAYGFTLGCHVNY
jgi:glycine cleavage system aminomethyltransferase T